MRVNNELSIIIYINFWQYMDYSIFRPLVSAESQHMEWHYDQRL